MDELLYFFVFLDLIKLYVYRVVPLLVFVSSSASL